MRKFVRVAIGTDPVGLPAFLATETVNTVAVRKDETYNRYYLYVTSPGFSGTITTTFPTVQEALTAADRYFDLEDPDDEWKIAL